MNAPFVPPPAGEACRAIRLMLVDDSAVARSIFQRMLAARPGLDVVAVAGDVAQALDTLARVSVDIILLDVEMPGIDGLTALPRLLEAAGGARVMIVSSAPDVGVRALTLGAADVLAKPGAGSFGGRFADTLADKLHRIGHAPRTPRPRAAAAAQIAAPIALRAPVSGPVGCIAIGASTGGLHALSAFFRALPDSVQVPILVTQHLPAPFMPYFASQLRDLSGRRAKVAESGDRLEPGRLLIAPGDGHLTLTPAERGPRAWIDRMPAPSGCQPSVDPMLASVAEHFGAAAIAVVLSGMGRDGAIAAPVLADAGGEVLVQDAASSVIWGMPGAIAVAGDAAGVLPPDQIARRIARRIAAAAAQRDPASSREHAGWR